LVVVVEITDLIPILYFSKNLGGYLAQISVCPTC